MKLNQNKPKSKFIKVNCSKCKNDQVIFGKPSSKVICNTCGLPDDLCACVDLNKDTNHIIIRLETRRFKKKGTMIDGLDPKIHNLENIAKVRYHKLDISNTYFMSLSQQWQ